MDLVIKAFAIVALLAIVASLGFGMVFMLRDKSTSKRTVNALTVRITLSVILFLIVLLAMVTGVVAPNRPF